MQMQVKENYQRKQKLWEGMMTELFQTTSKDLQEADRCENLQQRDAFIRVNTEGCNADQTLTENILDKQHSPAESLQMDKTKMNKYQNDWMREVWRGKETAPDLS